jgi:hypothetical protein
MLTGAPVTMPETHLTAMDDLNSAFAAQDAADALNALGLPVQAAEDDTETWRIGFFVLTDDELISLASRRGIRPTAEMVQ